jgi:hypothetical protein
VGGVTDEEGRTLDAPMSLLDPGKRYVATIYADADADQYRTNPQAYVIYTEEVTSDSVIPIPMAPGGGFAISLTEK